MYIVLYVYRWWLALLLDEGICHCSSDQVECYVLNARKAFHLPMAHNVYSV